MTVVTTTCNRCGASVQAYAGTSLRCPNCGNEGTAPIVLSQPQVIVVHQPGRPISRRDVGVAYLLWFFLGLWGAHKFYLGQTGMGVLYIFTAGICGIGLLVDLFTMSGQVAEANGE